jgi:cytochrome c-type biogenesis protein CcmH/NrfG
LVDDSAPDPVAAAVAHVEAEIAASPDNAKTWLALALGLPER